MPPSRNSYKRYIFIDKILRSKQHPYPSLSDIAEIYEDRTGINVSESQIEKDIKSLRDDEELGFFAPIKYSRKHLGYEYTDPEFSIIRVSLTGEHILAIRYAVSILQQFEKDTHLSIFQEAVEKLITMADLMSLDKGKQHIEFEYQPNVKGRELIDPLLSAIEDRLVCNFDYRSGHNPDKNEILRSVVGYQLKEHRGRWYLISYCLEKKDIRTWALDRIENLKLKQRVDIPIPPFNSVEYFKHSFGITVNNEGEPIEYIYSFDPEERHYLQAIPLHSSQKVLIDNENEFRISIKVYPSEELERTITSYGNSVKRIK